VIPSCYKRWLYKLIIQIKTFLSFLRLTKLKAGHKVINDVILHITQTFVTLVKLYKGEPPLGTRESGVGELGRLQSVTKR